MIATQETLIHDLQRLGLAKGDTVLVHSALSALGHVEGGADTVIDALLAVIGCEGTLAMPALSSGVFDLHKSPAKVGLITETFRRRKGVVRSFHPSHSVTAYGAHALALTAGHLQCPTACGEGTPYAKLMEMGGKILLLGVDQDRNTSLHTLEAMVRLPYLKTITREYKDPETAEIKTLEIREYPGPHRDFIALDARFREAGIMTTGKVGRSVSRLIQAQAMRDLGLAALRKDPAVILCDNPHCHDCVSQRACIKRHRLETEDFRLCATSDAVGETLEETLDALTREGIRLIELRTIGDRPLTTFSDGEVQTVHETILQRGFSVPCVSSSHHEDDWHRLIDLAALLQAESATIPLHAYQPGIATYAAAKKIALHLENHRESSQECTERFETIASSQAALAFHPAHFASMGEKPFLRIYSRTALKRRIAHLILADGTFAGESTLPARGNGEVKELLSILRCASFDGLITLRCPTGFTFAQTMAAFWEMLDTM